MSDDPEPRRPTPERLRAREEAMRARFGRLGRLRSWRGILMGLLLLVLAFLLYQYGR